MKTPRYYQTEALNAINEWFADGTKKNPIVVAATGTGKALIIAEYIRMALDHDPSVRAICAIDTKELVEQNYKTFMEQMPFAPAGIYSSGLKRRQKKSQILFCGIQSVSNKAHEIGRADILLIDECHGVALNGGRYDKFINDLLIINPHMIVIGFTATPYRMDSGLLWTGKDAFFEGVCYEYSIKQGIADGYLSNIIPKSMETKFDVSQVGKSMGDYKAGELEAAINIDSITSAAIDEIIEFGQNRKAWLVFGSGVKHCLSIKRIMDEKGIHCEIVLGETPDKERDEIIKDFKAGKIKCLINNAVLTKGFDAPFIDLIAMLRPTLSAVLWLQMCGRGFRIAPDKNNCLLLDFAENVNRFGFIDQVEFKDKKDKEENGVPPMKECPECSTICFAAVKFCPECGHEFPPSDEVKINASSHAGAVLSTQRIIEEFIVTDIDIQKHDRKDPPSLRVTYYCGMQRFSEWICLEHTGFARTKAVQWWKENTDGNKCKDTAECTDFLNMGVPATVDEAILFKHTIKIPRAIQVVKEGKYDRIVGRSVEEFESVAQSPIEPYQPEEDDFGEIAWL